MRVAFITSEFPPDIAQGGIATYVLHISKTLNVKGLDVEVFAASYDREISEVYEGVLVHRVKVNILSEFQLNVLTVFQKRHAVAPFDLIESPEINAEALKIKQKFSDLPLVVKLHTPAFLIVKLHNWYTPWFVKLRFNLGALRSFSFRFWGELETERDRDLQFTKLANGINSPSKSLKKIVSQNWGIPSNAIKILPYPYFQDEAFLQLEPYKADKFKSEFTLLFIGKINVHKGLVNLIKSLPRIIKKVPNLRLILIGSDGPSPKSNVTMKSWILDNATNYLDYIRFTGGINRIEIVNYIKTADACIFPSIWENFPYVCLEAMASARPIIGSKEGGMAEMLSEGAGILINPHSVKSIANAVIEIHKSPALREAIAIKAREKVLNKYNPLEIAEQTILYYKSIINKNVNG